MTDKVVDLFDRYIVEVGRHLPKKQYDDVGMEIRSLLEDTLDDRCQAQGREPDEEMVVEILKELGPPSNVAASYTPERYLIGPKYYPAFLRVLKITLAVMAVLAMFGVLVGLTQSGGELALLEPLADLVSSAMGSLGMLVLIFAILERTLPSPEDPSREWNPRKLAAVDQRDRVRPAGLIFDLGASLAVIILLNFFSQKVGIYSNTNGVWRFTPILTPQFALYLPWINIRLILGLIFNVALLRQGQWRPWNRAVGFGLRLFSLAILYSMIIGRPVLEMTGNAKADNLVLVCIFISLAISLVRQFLRWFRPEPVVIPLR